MSEVEPLFAFTRRMQVKDPALYERICLLPINQAAEIWRQTYPNDLAAHLPPHVELTPEQEIEFVERMKPKNVMAEWKARRPKPKGPLQFLLSLFW